MLIYIFEIKFTMSSAYKYMKYLITGLLLFSLTSCFAYAENKIVNHLKTFSDLHFVNSWIIQNSSAYNKLNYLLASNPLDVSSKPVPLSAYLGTWETEKYPDALGLYEGYQLEVYRPLLNDQIIIASLKSFSGSTNSILNFAIKIFIDEGSVQLVDLKLIDGIVKPNFISLLGSKQEEGDGTLMIRPENLNMLHLRVNYKINYFKWDRNFNLTLFRVSN